MTDPDHNGGAGGGPGGALGCTDESVKPARLFAPSSIFSLNPFTRLSTTAEEVGGGDADDEEEDVTAGQTTTFTNRTNPFCRIASAIAAEVEGVKGAGGGAVESVSANSTPFFSRRFASDTTSQQTSPSPRNRTPSPRTGQHQVAAPAAASGSSSSALLSVPRRDLGAIPRQQTPPTSLLPTPRLSVDDSSEGAPSGKSSLNSSATTTPSSGTGAEPKRCFCGYYSEAATGRGKKPGRCRFCRSKAKYVPGQRSFDAAKIFSRRKERAEPRRAISEDRRSDGQTTEDTSASTSSATTASSSFDRPSPGSRPHSFFSTLRRQERTEAEPPSPNLLSVPTTVVMPQQVSPRDHGLRTPPTPPSSLPLRSREDDQRRLPTRFAQLGSLAAEIPVPDERHLTHRMAHEMPEYLVPPPRTSLLAHTDPASIYEPPGATPPMRPQPASPPPAYSEVIKEPRVAPPTYEEALSTRVQEMRLAAGQPRSLSEERTRATRGGRTANRPLTRSSRAEEIPDIYWEQAARELDFCTCRKCQARYRQYFEEAPGDPGGDAMILMETQVLMQEVLTDGMAFCSLM